MITTGKALLTICWLALLGVLASSATQHPTVMCIAALVGAIACIGWGLTAALTSGSDEDPMPIRCEHFECVLDDGHPGLHEYPWGDSILWPPDADLDEDELPHHPAEKLPVWETSTWGAPE